MAWHNFQSTENVAKDPPVKVDRETEVHEPFSLTEVHVLNRYDINNNYSCQFCHKKHALLMIHVQAWPLFIVKPYTMLSAGDI